jgi:HD-GYP domain-containing protein (c-di-GMP phosphodiesterase class II)
MGGRNMQELFLGQKGKYIEKVIKKTEELTLLAKGDETEIMHLKITAGEMFQIDPGEKDRLMEFFYIIKGTVMYDNEGETIYLNEGEYCYVKSLKEPTYFKTITEVNLLYITNQPVFHLLSKEIEKLSEMRRLVEKKDLCTYEHEVRTRRLVVGIGEKLNLSKGQVSMLYYSAIFHDIGKINVPDEILNKPGKLTFKEFECVKKHAAEGADIISATFIKDAANAVLEHHERLDGSGYPQGLKGEKICIEGKIIGVVDTYDAMISDRPYKKGVSPIEAMKEIKGLIGKHYDEEVVMLLEEILKEDGII